MHPCTTYVYVLLLLSLYFCPHNASFLGVAVLVNNNAIQLMYSSRTRSIAGVASPRESIGILKKKTRQS